MSRHAENIFSVSAFEVFYNHLNEMTVRYINEIFFQGNVNVVT